MREMKLQELKTKTPAELVSFAEELEVENASTMRKQELMFGILKQLSARETDIVGEGVVEVLPDGFGFLRSPEANYLPGPGRYLRLALANPPLRLAHRRHDRRPYPQPEGRRALFRSAQGQLAQLRGPRKGAPQGQFRQSDAALSGRVAEDGIRGSDQEGSLGARHRHRGAGRQRPARPDRVAAAHRQDRAAAEHRPLDHAQSSGMLSDRAPDRRAAGRSHRHAALGEGRGDFLDLRRAGGAPRPGRRDGHREGQAPGRARPRRRDPARLRSPGSAAPTTPWCRRPARC